MIAGITNLTDEKYYDPVFANGIESAPASLRLRMLVVGLLMVIDAGIWRSLLESLIIQS